MWLGNQPPAFDSETETGALADKTPTNVKKPEVTIAGERSQRCDGLAPVQMQGTATCCFPLFWLDSTVQVQVG